jgi:hypothetical protein
MGNNPSHFAGKPRHPVENVSWNHVQEFLNKLNSRPADGGLMYRLPGDRNGNTFVGVGLFLKPRVLMTSTLRGRRPT